jgi:hypothetical protein
MNNYTIWGLASIAILGPPLLGQNSLILKQFQDAKWETPYDAWRAGHPAAKCRAFDGTGFGADEQWCYRCVETAGAETYEWSFYAFDVAAPVCRLGQLRAWQSGSVISETRRAVEAALVGRYGPSDSDNAVGEWASGFWHDIQHFRDAQGEVYLYRRVQRGQPDAVELLGRSRQLVAARAEDPKLADLEEQHRAPIRTRLDQRLMQDLGAAFPAVRTLLGEDSDETRRAMRRETLQALLTAAAAATGDRKAELVLAADRVASLIPEGQSGDPTENQRSETIAGFSLRYRYSPLGAAWNYQHDLLRQVWRESPNTAWGVEAFLLLTWMGWDGSGICEAGSDQFREVIAQGEKFLADHPANPHRLNVTLAVGTAYETWWSLSRAQVGDDYVEAAKYRDGAEAAKRKAISIYEQIANLAPDSPEGLCTLAAAALETRHRYRTASILLHLRLSALPLKPT